jgi:hypothetical protein
LPASIIPFDEAAILLIGAPSEALDFHINDKCQTEAAKIADALQHSSEIITLGTSETELAVDQHALQFGVAKGVVANYSFTIKPRPGILFKTILAFHWAKENPHPDPRSLDLCIGMEISACTGNAQRTALWELFQLPNVQDYTQTVFPSSLVTGSQK